VGSSSGRIVQGTHSVAVGFNAGMTSQGGFSVAIGFLTGQTSQGGQATALGLRAGESEQATYAVAVGTSSGRLAQASQAVAVGYLAGNSAQSAESTAVGNKAGQTAQGSFSTALGSLAGRTAQGTVATAIGREAGLTSQGNYALAVGYRAGYSEQGANSIILNATNATFNSTTASSFHVKPVRGGNMTASALSYTSTGEIVEQTNIHFASANTMHVYKAAAEATSGLLIEKANGGLGTAASLLFGVTAASETNNVGVPKAGIIFERTATNGRGKLQFCVDNVDDTNAVGIADSALMITSQGFVQPGQIDLSKPGAGKALGGNYLFQAVYHLYRTNGYASSTFNSVFQKFAQVVRNGSLLCIRGYSPLTLTSSTLNYQFTWAELGCDGQRSLVTLINQSTASSGTWGNATGNATYLTLPSTGHTGNGGVDYNNLIYLIDLGAMASY
jgi:hypothetical protein